MPSQQRRSQDLKQGKQKKLKSQLGNSVSPKSHQWQLFAFGLLIALTSIAAYRWFSHLPQSKQENTITVSNLKDEPIFTVVDIPGKGKGVLAARNIKQGEVILREKPLFIVPLHIQSSPAALVLEKVKALPSRKQEAFFNLSFVHFPEHLEPEKHVDELALAIFQTNAVSSGKDAVGIFPNMARLNHGCSSAFNAVYSWRDDQEILFVHALKNIQKGKELLTTYTDTKRPREERRAYLSSQYGFQCTCDVCSFPDNLSKASDQRLSKMVSLQAKFATWGNREIDGMEAIRHIRTIWQIGDVEGYWSERGQLAADAAWIAAAHSDATAARAWALKAVEWFGYELGPDSAQVQRLIQVVDRPESHNAWGTRDRLDVGGP